MTTPVHPHDLLRIDPGRVTEMLTPVDPGQWQMIDGCLERAPFVVVRRACAGAGLIPVGIRGEERSQRFAAWLDPNGICEVIRPESLRRRDKSRELPVFAALRALDHRWLPSLPSWGPAGSVGFELASGVLTASPGSDLDVIVRAPQRLLHSQAQALAEHCADLMCAVDVQVETPNGAFALQEFLKRPRRILLRTCQGPMLVQDPWQLIKSDKMSA